MAKYEFEWDEQDVDVLQATLNGLLEGDLLPVQRSLLHDMANKIREQKPVPLPTKLGAVIEFADNRYVLASEKDQVWVRLLASGSYDGARSAGDLPTSGFKVLFEGVDL